MSKSNVILMISLILLMPFLDLLSTWYAVNIKHYSEANPLIETSLLGLMIRFLVYIPVISFLVLIFARNYPFNDKFIKDNQLEGRGYYFMVSCNTLRFSNMKEYLVYSALLFAILIGFVHFFAVINNFGLLAFHFEMLSKIKAILGIHSYIFVFFIISFTSFLISKYSIDYFIFRDINRNETQNKLLIAEHSK